jgi:hypothetical protein
LVLISGGTWLAADELSATRCLTYLGCARSLMSPHDLASRPPRHNVNDG